MKKKVVYSLKNLEDIPVNDWEETDEEVGFLPKDLLFVVDGEEIVVQSGWYKVTQHPGMGTGLIGPFENRSESLWTD